MGQHQSLVPGEENVSIIPAAPNDSELSFRAAIDKFIETCLSNPQNSHDGMHDTSESTNEVNEIEDQTAADISSSETIDGISANEEKVPEVSSGEPFDRVKTFSSFLQTRIRDMIVNCENDDDLCVSDQTKLSSASCAPSSLSLPALPASSPHVPTSTIHTIVSSSNCTVTTSVTKESKSYYNSSEKASVPLQTLIDKELDNSLGEASVCKPVEQKHIMNNNTENLDTADHKPKGNMSYEIAAESAKFVSEKVARCVERNVNNSENSASAKSEKAGICLMAHIQKVLEHNFAQMSQEENESTNQPLRIMSQLSDLEDGPSDGKPQVKSSTATASAVEAEVAKSSSTCNPLVTNNKTVTSNTYPGQSVTTNPDGSISVQDIVDRVISQTEVISKLLTPEKSSSSAIATTVCGSQNIPLPNQNSHHMYERSIIKTVNVSKSDPLKTSNRRESQHIDPYRSFHPNPMREDLIKQSMVTTHSPDFRYNQAMINGNTMLHKNPSYMPSELSELQHVDHRMLTEAQKHKMIQDNMLHFSRYPYPMHMGSTVEPNHGPSHLIGYMPPVPAVQHRIPPPLLRVDAVTDTSLASMHHPYNKSCACGACSSQRAEIEEIKRSQKQHNTNLLVPPNSVTSPSMSPHYLSRVSPHSPHAPHAKDPKNVSPSSPQRYHHASAFTRINNHSFIDHERAQKAYTEDVIYPRKSRIDNGIDMLYGDRKRQPEGYAVKAHEHVYSKPKYQANSPSRISGVQQNIAMKPPLIEVACGSKIDSNIQIASDQPLDLTKKKPKILDHLSQDKWNLSRMEQENYNKAHPQKHLTVDQRLLNSSGYSIPDKYSNSAGKELGIKSHDRFVPSQLSASYYPPKHDLPRVQEPSAAMTPGMMPEQLGSPGGIRPQLHPLPSPNVSTSYAQSAPSQSPHLSNHITSTIRGSPGVERAGPSVVDTNNLSRPSSQCSTSSLDQDKDRRGSVSRHEPIQNIIGAHPPNDILYLICRLCRQTYGSPYGFRKHFRNQHGFEPRAEHTIVQTISATKSAMQHIPGLPNSPINMPHSPINMPHSPNLMQGSLQPVIDGSVYDSVDIPKVRERALSDSRLPKSATYSETKSSRPSCSRSAESQRDAVKEETDDTKFLQCEQCKQTFQLNDFGSYKRHCRQHNQTRVIGPFHCQICPNSFQEPHLLEEHMLKHDSEAVVCKYCKIPYANRTYLVEHMNKVHGHVAYSNRSWCNHCHLSFEDDNELLAHIRMVHDGLSSSDCTHNKLNTECLHSEHPKEKPQAINHVDVQPADQMTILSCPDSSSDNIAQDKNYVPMSCSSTDTRCNSNDSSLDTTSSITNSDCGEESFYKHKKFFGHRKRKESAETSPVPPKCVKTYEESRVLQSDEMTADNSVSCSSSSSNTELEKSCDSSVNGTDMCSPESKSKLLNKQEARHHMPFVWDRITRSQAGKNIKPPDYMS